MFEKWNGYKYYIAVGILIVFLGGLIWYFLSQGKTEKVTPVSQITAETSGGVWEAADNAKINIDSSQAKEAAKDIQHIYKYDKKPSYTITTTGDKAPSTTRDAQKRAGADFSIVTDKGDPNTAIDITKIDKDKIVNLNQYNIHAYKKILRTVEVVPDIEAGGCGISEVGVSVARKITDDGKYIGVGVNHNVDNHKTYVKVSYTW